ncbi:MAG: hypothetical protein EPO46_10485 [Lysobacter sp.]|nr:MAG: hypothetical protein EPO46_10485 [Lysobacter sp.]
MTLASPCRGCGCIAANALHSIVDAVLEDDIDHALELGLLDVEPCGRCEASCRQNVLDARDARRTALAARERFRRREQRLARRAAERSAAGAMPPEPAAPGLPPGAAAVLARALSRARLGAPP